MVWPKSTLPRSTRESNRTGRCCTDSTSKCRLAAGSSIWEGLFGTTTTTADHAVGRVLENLSGSPADGRFSPYHSLIPARDFECCGLFRHLSVQRRQQSPHCSALGDFRLTTWVVLGSTLTCSPMSVWRSGKSRAKYPWSALGGTANNRYSPGITPTILY